MKKHHLRHVHKVLPLREILQYRYIRRLLVDKRKRICTAYQGCGLQPTISCHGYHNQVQWFSYMQTSMYMRVQRIADLEPCQERGVIGKKENGDKSSHLLPDYTIILVPLFITL